MPDWNYYWRMPMMFFIWIPIIIFMVWITFRLMENGRKNGYRESALDILKRRFANGEISKAEFEEMKRTLRQD